MRRAVVGIAVAASVVGGAIATAPVASAGTTYTATGVTTGNYWVFGAVDPVSHQLYVDAYDTSPYGVAEVDPATGLQTQKITLGTIADDAVYDPASALVFFVTPDQNAVVGVDPSTNTVAGTVPVGSRPTALAVDPGAHRLYVGNNGASTVTVVDTQTLQVVNTISLRASVLDIAVDTSSHLLFATNYTAQSVDAFDTVTGAFSGSVGFSSPPTGLVVDSAVHRLFVALSGTDLGVVDSLAVAPLPAIPVTGNSGRASFAIDTTHHAVYIATGEPVVDVIDTRTLTRTVVPLGGQFGSYGIVADSSTGTAYAFSYSYDGADSAHPQKLWTITSQPSSTASIAPPSCTYLTCSFDGSASTGADGTVASYAWSFGDGATGTGATPSHTYASAGTYTVSLVVTDGSGSASDPATTSVTVVANQAPTAVIATPSCTYLGCTFDGSGSTDPDGTIASYAWNFGDGSTGTGANPTHVYASRGTYTVRLTVTDDQGATSAAVTTRVTVKPNVAPTAVIAPASCTYLTCSFDGSGSSDSDGTVASYAWNFGDGTRGTGAQPTHTYTRAGSFKVSLVVTDDAGKTGPAATQTVTVVANVRPTASFTSPCVERACSFDASASSDPDGTIVDYAWTFGDGTTANGRQVTHTYAARGTYSVRLTVRDDMGATGTVTRSLVVTAPNQAPTASFGSNGVDLAAVFDGRPSSDVDGTVASYAWDFGDGTSATGGVVRHRYLSTGVYPVTLSVTDNEGLTGTKTQWLTVSLPRVKVLVSDNFNRSVTNSWGVATTGYGWSMGAANRFYSVLDNTGRIAVGPNNTIGISPTAFVLNTTQTVDVGVVGPAPSSGVYASLAARRTVGAAYKLKVLMGGNGQVQVTIVKVAPGVADTVLGSTTLSGVSFTAATTLRMRFSVSGSGTTTLAGTVWDASQPEPTAATLNVTDATPGDLQQANGVGIDASTFGLSPTGTVVTRFANYSLVTP